MRFLKLCVSTLASVSMTACVAEEPDTVAPPPDPVAPAPSSKAGDPDAPSPSRVITDHLLAEVTIGNGNRYAFVGVPGEDGAITSVGVIETGTSGLPSISGHPAVHDLDVLGVFRALTAEEIEPPAALVAVAQQIGSPRAPGGPRGWLAAELGIAAVPLYGNCSNAWFSDQHGPGVGSWEHGWNALDRLDPDSNAGTYLAAQTSWGTEDWRSGVCVQEQDSWYDRTQIKYLIRNCADCNLVGAGTIDEAHVGEYHTYTLYTAGPKQFRFEVRAYDLFGGGAYGVYDLGLNWND